MPLWRPAFFTLANTQFKRPSRSCTSGGFRCEGWQDKGTLIRAQMKREGEAGYVAALTAALSYMGRGERSEQRFKRKQRGNESWHQPTKASLIRTPLRRCRRTRAVTFRRTASW